jgi:hypothetical protein
MKSESYRDWRGAVDQLLQQTYCITLEDAGFDEEYLTSIWQSGEAPFEFLEWLGSKYALDPIPSLVPHTKRNK